jgi:hypothetical protein
MTISQILDLPFNFEDKELTIRDYLKLLLLTLWEEQEGFSGKRPFGNSGWERDLYIPLIKAGVIAGTIDSDGYINYVDSKMGHKVIENCIHALQ